MKKHRRILPNIILAATIVLLQAPSVLSDTVIDWNVTANQVVAGAALSPGPANRTMAMVQTAVYAAVNSIIKKYRSDLMVPDIPADASIDAAVAAANHAILSGLVPSQKETIEKAYHNALAAIPNGAAKEAGITAGEKAAAAVVTARAGDKVSDSENYRPHTSAGVYVPTVIPVYSNWNQRKPWIMTSPEQFRPGPPPELRSEIWARDYNEIKAIGSKNSPVRTPEQTEIARFWEATGPIIYYPIIRSVAEMPGREIAQNARLFAAASQAMDDAIISVFDAKYHYHFWRPITAIRNGDIDGNADTEREESWRPFIETPPHPEYPCAHCIISAAVGEVLRNEVGDVKELSLSSTSPTLPGVTRHWKTIDDFTQEVANARIYDGVHYRNSTEVGASMGRKIGKLAAEKWLK